MVLTPWGEVGTMEGGNRRDRLLAAMVGSCTTRGFEATRVEDLLEPAGVSRTGFYELFENKHDCFEAMLAEVAADVKAVVDRRVAAATSGPARVRAALTAIAQLIETQPAAARACLIDAFAAGPRARETMVAGVGDFESVLTAALAEVDGHEAMPAEMAAGLAGAVYKIFQRRVGRGETDGLSELAPRLAEWLLSQEPPPKPLRPGRGVAVVSPFSPTFAHHDPVGRILRAVAQCIAERGYPATTIAEIASRARVSQRTFYDNFTGKEEATVASLDASGAQMLAAAMPAVRRAPDWPSAVYGAYAAMCGFMAAEPDFARLRTVEVYAAGATALEIRDRTGAELLGALLAAAPDDVTAKAEPLLLEAISGAVYALAYHCVQDRGPQELPRIIPLTVYLALSPFIGSGEACEVANGEGKRRGKQVSLNRPSRR